eukprot:TRINITY_DN14321_c0_g1_i3.p1 TRINITY_DN14321_c0_g1~~TRINITY_DN14321_c0_g1_i3.p1  ORF type:complete len:169 (-),score=46.66 TRINITY_DN14321_c0_g1_i3:207-713(-)
MCIRDRRLMIAECQGMSDEGVRILSESPNLKDLAHLNLCGLNVTNKSLQYLAESKVIQNLEELSVESCPNINDEGVKNLLASPNFEALKILLLDCTKISDESLTHLAKADSFRNLAEISLQECEKITDHGVEQLVSSNNLRKLKSLSLENTKISQKLKQNLRSKGMDV